MRITCSKKFPTVFPETPVGDPVRVVGVFSTVETHKFHDRFEKICQKGTESLAQAIIHTIQYLCMECSRSKLQRAIHFHQLTNYSIERDGVVYKNPYEVHIFHVDKVVDNNNLCIAFVYHEDIKEIELIDIGSHDYLFKKGKVTNSYLPNMDQEIIYL